MEGSNPLDILAEASNPAAATATAPESDEAKTSEPIETKTEKTESSAAAASEGGEPVTVALGSATDGVSPDSEKNPEAATEADEGVKDDVEMEEQAPAESKASNRIYKVGTIVYKMFFPHWFFGHVVHVDGGLYAVRYEDGDREDLDKAEMDEIAVILEDGTLAETATPPGEAGGNEESLKPVVHGKTGSVDIITTQPDLYGNLNRDFLVKYIEARHAKERDTRRGDDFPKYPLGTIVYKKFKPKWFFGHVGRIDTKDRFYGVRYEDGDKEEVLQNEMDEIAVILDDGTAALVSTIPGQVSAEEWHGTQELKDVKFPGSVEIVDKNELFKDLDSAFLAKYIKERKSGKKTKKLKVVKPNEKKRPRSVRPFEAIVRATKRAKPIKPISTAASPPPAKPPTPRRARINWRGPSIPKDSTPSVYDKTSEGQLSKKVLEFFEFLYERQTMWVRRNKKDYIKTESGDLVLTLNPTMQNFFFCNVYRELDRGTAYFHNYIMTLRESKETWDEKEWLDKVLWASYVYRQVNRVETFEALDGIPSLDDFEAFSKKALKHAEKNIFFTGAHQTTKIGTLLNNLRTYAKATRGGEKLLKDKAAQMQAAANVKECLAVLGTLKGVGNFFAWQIFCDLRESGCLKQWESDDFCKLGPGAEKGLDSIFGRGNINASLEEAQKLVGCQDVAFRQLGVRFPYWQGQKLTIKEIEHGLCEYSKYTALKAHARGGRAYKPRPTIDVGRPCLCVSCKEKKDAGSECDTCYGFYCVTCEAPTTSASWLCQRCIKFRGKPFVEHEEELPEPNASDLMDVDDKKETTVPSEAATEEQAKPTDTDATDEKMSTEDVKDVETAEEVKKGERKLADEAEVGQPAEEAKDGEDKKMAEVLS